MSSGSAGRSRSVHISRWLVAGVLGASIGWLSFSHLAPPDFRKLVIPVAVALGMATVATVLAYGVVVRGTWPRLADRSRLARVLWVLGSGAAAGLLILVIPLTLPSPPLPYAPLQRLEIVATGKRNAAARSSEVWVKGLIRPGGARVAPGEFVLEGDWEVRDGVPLSYRNWPSTLRWEGRLRGDAKLRLISHPWSGIAEITWNDQVQTIDLYNDPTTVKTIPLPVEAVSQSLRVLGEASVAGAYIVALGTLMFLLSVWLVTRRPWAVPRQPPRCAWLYYALPCALSWAVALIAYWPGLMSPDSLDQWQQMVSGRFRDAHPAFHTMTNWLITRVWLSPATVATAQIIALSAVVGWGLARMRALGMPRCLAWTTCALFAVSPVNQAMVVTLWKDIPYSITFLAFLVLLLDVVVSRGERLRRRCGWLTLAIAAALVTLYRHNGLPAVFGTLIVLVAVYWRYWKWALLTIAVAGALVFAMRGPLYKSTGVQGVRWYRPTWWQIPVIHILAAHVSHQTPVTEDERGLLEGIRPPGPWPYDPYYFPTLYRDGKVNKSFLGKNRYRIARLVWTLTLRRPDTTLRRLAERGSLVWRIARPPNSCYYCTALESRHEPRVITASRQLGVSPRPLVPGLDRWFIRWVNWTRTQPEAVVWRPALYMYVFLAGGLVAALRRRHWQYLVLIVPIGIQSAVIALVTPGQDFRYQYPVYLAGLMMAGFLVWSAPLIPLAASVQSPRHGATTGVRDSSLDAKD